MGRGTRLTGPARAGMVRSMRSEAVENRRAGQESAGDDQARTEGCRLPGSCRKILVVAVGSGITERGPTVLFGVEGYGLVGWVQVSVHAGSFPSARGAGSNHERGRYRIGPPGVGTFPIIANGKTADANMPSTLIADCVPVRGFTPSSPGQIMGCMKATAGRGPRDGVRGSA